MIIQLSQINHLPQIFEIFQDCKLAMEKEGIFQWNQGYPNIEVISNDILKGHSYGLYDENTCVGVISINTDQEPAYKSVKWEDTGLVLIIHRLTIAPSYQKNGFARSLMDFAESYGLKNGFTSIRLDAYSGNLRVINFYETRGYIKRGEIYFAGRDLPFFCLEKRL